MFICIYSFFLDYKVIDIMKSKISFLEVIYNRQQKLIISYCDLYTKRFWFQLKF